jgi:hypothetical protein
MVSSNNVTQNLVKNGYYLNNNNPMAIDDLLEKSDNHDIKVINNQIRQERYQKSVPQSQVRYSHSHHSV